jgi:hypothetical protein
MKLKRVTLIRLNVIAVLFFALSIFFDAGYITIIGSLILLWGSAIFTVIKLHDKSNRKSRSPESYSFLVSWMLFALVMFLFSILIWDRNNLLFLFSIIFSAYLIGAMFGKYSRSRRIKKVD